MRLDTIPVLDVRILASLSMPNMIHINKFCLSHPKTLKLRLLML